MASVDTATNQTPPVDGPPRATKRAQVKLACNTCRRRKIKCDGTRPVCEQCSSHKSVCIYSEAVGAHPTTLLKRRYTILEERSGDEHEVLELLRSSRRDDALRMLECIRAGDDAHSVVDFALCLSSANIVGRALPSDTLPQDQRGAVSNTVPTLDSSVLVATPEVLSHEVNIETRIGESRGQATKRKHDELHDEHDALKEIVAIANSRRDGLDVLQRLRNCRNVLSLLTHLKEGNLVHQSVLDPGKQARQMLLIGLMQSTAPLREIIGFVAKRLGENKGQDLLALIDVSRFRNRVFNINALGQNMLSTTHRPNCNEAGISGETKSKSVDSNPTEQRQLDKASAGETLDAPAFSVPSQPWTNVTADDALVSHLISVFLLDLNPYWRHVEEDLFLHDMRSPLNSTLYCSPLLVNAICALSCLSSECEGAFVEKANYITRGEHFQEEAMRLWLLEEGKVSLTNLQALIILSLSACWRGKDKLGTTLLAVVIQTNRDLSIAKPLSTLRASGYARARTCSAWTAHFLDVTVSNGLMRDSAPIDTRLGYVPPLLEHTAPQWCCRMPQVGSSISLANTLFRERCVLTRLTSELNALLFTRAPFMEALGFIQAADRMKAKLSDWYSLLPFGLSWQSDLPLPIFDMHTEYACAMMTLCSMIEKRAAIGRTGDQFTPANPVPSRFPESVSYARQASAMLERFRRKYGLKINVSHIFHAEAMSCFILLPHLKPNLESQIDDPEVELDIKSAFEESFRCLLGTGTQVMLGRGVARMVFQTSKQLGIPLPTSVLRVLEVVAETAWRQVDILEIKSSYPNHALADDGEASDSARMEELLNMWEAAEL